MSRQQQPFDLLLFDLDGVVTTEHIYWECARLTVWELLQVHLPLMVPYVPAVHDAHARAQVIPLDLIYAIKNRAINSNWDLAFLVACSLLRALPAGAGRDAATLDAWLEALQSCRPAHDWRSPVEAALDEAGDLSGAGLVAHAGRQAAQHLEIDASLLTPEGPFWQRLYTRFQGWYSGRLMGLWGAARLPERPVIPVAEMQQIFLVLKMAGYELGIVTGRPLDEAEYALGMFSILDHFAPRHTVTFDDVMVAQQELAQSGLGKPHPFAVRKALWPEQDSETLLEGGGPSLDGVALMIGDSTSDAVAARRAGIPCLGVASGVQGAEAKAERRQALLEAGCVAVLDDIRALPAWLNE